MKEYLLLPCIFGYQYLLLWPLKFEFGHQIIGVKIPLWALLVWTYNLKGVAFTKYDQRYYTWPIILPNMKAISPTISESLQSQSEAEQKNELTNQKTMYSQTCIKRSPLWQRPYRTGDLLKFLWQDKKKVTFNTGDCLIEVTAWASLTTFKLMGCIYFIHYINL